MGPIPGRCVGADPRSVAGEIPVRGWYGAFVTVTPVLAYGPSMGVMPLGPLVGSPILMADNDDSGMARWRVITTHPLNDGHTLQVVRARQDRASSFRWSGPFTYWTRSCIGSERPGVGVAEPRATGWRKVRGVGATRARAGRLSGRRARAAGRGGCRGEGRALLLLS